MTECINFISVIGGANGSATVTYNGNTYVASAPLSMFIGLVFNANLGVFQARFTAGTVTFINANPMIGNLDLTDDCWKVVNMVDIASIVTTPDFFAVDIIGQTGPEVLGLPNSATDTVYCAITDVGPIESTATLSDKSNPCCMHPTTKVVTPSGIKDIKDIKAGDKVKDVHGRFINVNYNIKFMPTNKFVCVKKDAFGNNRPSEDLKATGEHPLVHNRKEVKFKDIVNGQTIVEQELKDEFVYSLCNRRRTYVMMNDVPVCTWAQREWERSRHSKAQKWFKL